MEKSKPTYEELVMQITELKQEKEHISHKKDMLEKDLRKKENQTLQDKKEAEKNESQLRAMLNAVPDLVFRIDQNGTFLSYKADVKDLYYQNDDIVGKNYKDLLPPFLVAKYNEIVEKTIRTNELQTFEYDLTIPNTGKRLYEARMSKSGIDEITTVIRDITEQKQAKQKLMEAKERAEINKKKLEETHKIAKLGSWELDINKEIFTFTDNFYAIFHTTAEEIGGYQMSAQKYAELFVHPNDRSMVADEIHKTIETDDPKFADYLEHRIKYFDGGVGFISVRVFITKDEFGNTIKAYGVNQDITELRNSQSELIIAKEKAEDSNKQFQKVVENFPDGIIVIYDKEYRYIFAEGLGLKDIGLNSEILLNKKTRDLFAADFCDLLEFHIDKALNGEKSTFEIKLENDYFKETVVPFKIENGEVTQVLGVINNITKGKKAEQELIQAKEKAEESSRLKTAFLRNISHEFRTPMNGILGFTSLLLTPNRTEKQRNHYAEMVKDNCDNLLEIVTDTIDISEIVSNLSTIKESQCLLNEIMDEILEQIKPKINKKGLQLVYKSNWNEAYLEINSDRRKIKRVLKHLIDNAIKFTSIGKVEVICENDNDNLYISINDTGIGIPKNMQEVIFEPFRQVELDMARSYSGNGVGLSLVKSYIEMLGGKIQLESEINKGTSVKISLPIISTDSPQEKINKIEKEEANLSKKTILVVEDEEINYLYLKEILDETGVNTVYAKNGQEGVDLCRNNDQIDLVLMDLKMPIMDGYEAIKLIKEFRTKLPIIAQTAYALESDIEKIIESGFDGYLTKPFEYDKLVELVKKTLN